MSNFEIITVREKYATTPTKHDTEHRPLHIIADGLFVFL